jgi:hypothetical protein
MSQRTASFFAPGLTPSFAAPPPTFQKHRGVLIATCSGFCGRERARRGRWWLFGAVSTAATISRPSRVYCESEAPHFATLAAAQRAVDTGRWWRRPPTPNWMRPDRSIENLLGYGRRTPAQEYGEPAPVRRFRRHARTKSGVAQGTRNGQTRKGGPAPSRKHAHVHAHEDQPHIPSSPLSAVRSGNTSHRAYVHIDDAIRALRPATALPVQHNSERANQPRGTGEEGVRRDTSAPRVHE